MAGSSIGKVPLIGLEKKDTYRPDLIMKIYDHLELNKTRDPITKNDCLKIVKLRIIGDHLFRSGLPNFFIFNDNPGYGIMITNVKEYIQETHVHLYPIDTQINDRGNHEDIGFKCHYKHKGKHTNFVTFDFDMSPSCYVPIIMDLLRGVKTAPPNRSCGVDSKKEEQVIEIEAIRYLEHVTRENAQRAEDAAAASASEAAAAAAAVDSAAAKRDQMNRENFENYQNYKDNTRKTPFVLKYKDDETLCPRCKNKMLKKTSTVIKCTECWGRFKLHHVSLVQGSKETYQGTPDPMFELEPEKLGINKSRKQKSRKQKSRKQKSRKQKSRKQKSRKQMSRKQKSRKQKYRKHRKY